MSAYVCVCVCAEVCASVCAYICGILFSKTVAPPTPFAFLFYSPHPFKTFNMPHKHTYASVCVYVVIFLLFLLLYAT